ncbi:hypothetical protein V2J09_010038 [Rumex salicifolius]
MEGGFNLPIDLSKQNNPTMEGFSSQTYSDRHIQSSFIWVNPCTHTISGLPMLSMIQEEPPTTKDPHSDISLTHLSSLQHFGGQKLCGANNNLPISLPQNVVHSDAFEAIISSGLSNPSYCLQSDHLGENMAPNDDWMSQNYMNLCSANNELSLRLSASSRPPIINEGSSNNNQCSDMGSSRLNKKPSHFSEILSQPRYLGVVQEILSQFASFSLENMDCQLSQSYIDHCTTDQGDSFKGSDESSNLGGVESLSHQRRDNEAKKSQLLALLQMLDDCYNRCLDEIHTVISAFHAATELDPQRHASFALRRISVVYKSLKERISKQILKLGALSDDGGGDGSDACAASGSCSREQVEKSFEKSFIQKQWALQQLKRKDQQLWRPQRGLPERSVSVLRAWMFQNFLHPYPKDAEKHLLAIKSGLTRSQVSNWFINARVRLWKPLIEEMYAELNRSRAVNEQQGNEESSNTYNCLSSIHDSRYSNG